MQYAVKNIGSGEMLSDWTSSKEEASKWAAECESHESQPEVAIVERITHMVRVDDHRYPPGDSRRAGGLCVRAALALGRGGLQVAELVEASNPHEQPGDETPRPDDVLHGLQLIEDMFCDDDNKDAE